MLMFVSDRHSATLMSQKLIIFGGRKTATYLNDLHVLDLGKMKIRAAALGNDFVSRFKLIFFSFFPSMCEGFMEYTAVKSGNMPPLPRGWAQD